MSVSVVKVVEQDSFQKKTVCASAYAFNRCGLIPRSLLCNGDSWSSQSPSFPRVFSGNPGETLTGPPIETFGGDDFKGISSWFVDTQQLAAGSSFRWRIH